MEDINRHVKGEMKMKYDRMTPQRTGDLKRNDMLPVTFYLHPIGVTLSQSLNSLRKSQWPTHLC